MSEHRWVTVRTGIAVPSDALSTLIILAGEVLLFFFAFFGYHNNVNIVFGQIVFGSVLILWRLNFGLSLGNSVKE